VAKPASGKAQGKMKRTLSSRGKKWIETESLFHLHEEYPRGVLRSRLNIVSARFEERISYSQNNTDI